MSIASILPNPHYEELDDELIGSIIEMMPSIVHVSDCETGKLLFANHKLTDILGYSTEDLQTITGNIFEEALADCSDKYSSDQAYYIVKHSVKCKNGDTAILSTRSTVHKLNEAGRPAQVVGISSDITKSELIEKERQRMEGVLNEAEKMMDFGSWTWLVPEDRIIWSDGLYKLLGYDAADRNELENEIDSYTRLVHPDDAQDFQKKTEHFLKTGEQYDDYEHRIVTPDGVAKVLTAKAKVAEFEADGKTIKRVVGSTIDSTYIKKIQRELELKVAKLDASNRDLEQFAYVASHDLQEPLRKIVAFGERLEIVLQDKMDAQAQLYISRMTDAANRMRELINNLLSLSRISDGEEPTQVSLNEVLNGVLKNHELKIEENKASITIGELPPLYGIESQLGQLFNNLVSNALKFTSNKVQPEITVSCEIMSASEKEEHKLLSGSKYVKISVQDNGIGFDDQYAEQIFIIFKRLHGRSTYSGTGIGLAICRKVVENHNGLIFAKSVENEGATFTIVLPEGEPAKL